MIVKNMVPGTHTILKVINVTLSDKSYLAENVIVPFDTSGIQEKVMQGIMKQ